MEILKQSDLIKPENYYHRSLSKKKALYVGPNASLYLHEFFPRRFINVIFGLEWPSGSAIQTRNDVKNRVFQLLRTREFEYLILHLDYDPLFYSEELVEIGDLVVIVGIFGDDASLVYFSSEIALYCDLILTTDPLQIARYTSIGVPALLHLYDVSSQRFPNWGKERDIDILIY